MSRRLDNLPRPTPARVRLTPLCRLLQAQVTQIALRSPVHGHALVEWNQVILEELDLRDAGRLKRRAG